MKNLFLSSCLACLFIVGIAHGQSQVEPASNVIKIMSGNTVSASGTSTFIIDLNSKEFGYRPTGDFSLQFKGFVAESPLGGATVSAAWRGCNVLPTGVTMTGLLPNRIIPTSKMASTAIVNGLNVVTGNTEYAYGFFTVDTVRYILVDITSGLSNLGISAYVKVD